MPLITSRWGINSRRHLCCCRRRRVSSRSSTWRRHRAINSSHSLRAITWRCAFRSWACWMSAPPIWSSVLKCSNQRLLCPRTLSHPGIAAWDLNANCVCNCAQYSARLKTIRRRSREPKRVSSWFRRFLWTCRSSAKSTLIRLTIAKTFKLPRNSQIWRMMSASRLSNWSRTRHRPRSCPSVSSSNRFPLSRGQASSCTLWFGRLLRDWLGRRLSPHQAKTGKILPARTTTMKRRTASLICVRCSGFSTKMNGSKISISAILCRYHRCRCQPTFCKRKEMRLNCQEIPSLRNCAS